MRTVTLCSEEFVPLARGLLAAAGLPDLPLAVVPHPMATRSELEVRAIAQALATEVLEALTTPARPVEAGS